MCDHCGCRSFAPIAELTGEHVEILDRAWALAEATGSDRPRPVDDVAGLLSLLDVHVAKEETGLYPELLDVGGLSQEDRGQLEQEHRELRAALVGENFDRRDYYALAAHIEVEEMELFSAAMLNFDERDWHEMEHAHHAADSSRP